MRKIVTLLLLALLVPTAASAQQIYRSEFAPYDTREDAIVGNHARTVNHIAFSPKILGEAAGHEVACAHVEIPTAWADYDVYLHVENSVKAYRLMVGESLVAEVDDPRTPADFRISPYLRQGGNDIMLLLHTPEHAALNEGSQNNLTGQFSGCYIYAQYRTHIDDYNVDIRTDKDDRVIFTLDATLSNSFGTEQPVTVGYDIYSPEGRLIDYAVKNSVVAGRSTGTVRFRTVLGSVEGRNIWGDGRAPLYRVMLYIKRDGKPREYIPFRTALVKASHHNGHILINGRRADIKGVAYNARTTAGDAAKEIDALKAQGYNTLMPTHPQPEWFYDLCDETGMYVIERANINPTRDSGNRAVGGTPSNDPSLAGEYVARVEAMYWRTRNHPCIIAYSLCGEKAGNGHCLYEAYRHLKGIEKQRAVICPSAAGEWNSDIESLQ